MNNEFNKNPQSEAEKLIFGVFERLEKEVDPQISRLHLENMLKQEPRRRPQGSMRLGFRLAVLVMALAAVGAWSSTLTLAPYDDAQQINIQLPADFQPVNYPHVLGIISKYTPELAEHGGHSLVVDYYENEYGRYTMQLGIIGVDYSEANSWFRSVMEREEWMQDCYYSYDQPLIPYRVKVRDMIAYRMGDKSAIERNVVRAWQETQWLDKGAVNPSDITLIGREKDYMKKASMVSGK
ncbi:MAG: hypothetical protein H7A35_07960 [Planctomycetales bacterium]|nr:hypothetical protein [bacterium]UNM09988.1 MAG: hypothetical protein H7A35_07960 [Planctomycetales bacterium]